MMKIFISHGHDEVAKLRLKDFISSQLKRTPLVLGEQPERLGLTIIESLERFSKGCDLALILLTADDSTIDGGRRARQNVIHEIGFFQGRFGRDRVVLIVQRGVDIPSNLAGIFYLEYTTDVKEVFNDLRLIIEAGRASASATEFVIDDFLKKKEKFDRFFQGVQEFIQKILAFKLETHDLFANANSKSGEEGVQTILNYDKLQGRLFGDYLANKNLLDADIQEVIMPFEHELLAASEQRSKAQDRNWLESHMDDAMSDRRRYEEAFDAFVQAISNAFNQQAKRLRACFDK